LAVQFDSKRQAEGKNSLRQIAREKRLQLESRVRIKLDTDIRQHTLNFLSQQCTRTALVADLKYVAMYAAFRGEVDVLTQEFIDGVAGIGLRVAVPKVDMQAGTMQFFGIREMANLHIGAYGVLEPAAHQQTYVGPLSMCAICVPGLVFTFGGSRLGYGGGYYDKFLASCPIPLRLGIGYHVQIANDIPNEAHDVGMTHVVTENGVVACELEHLS